MGDTKKEMTKTSSKKKDTKDSLFGRFSKKKEGKTDAPQTVADMIVLLDENLPRVREIKRKDFENEKGKESENAVKLAHLDTMQYYVDRLCDHADAYSDL